MRLPEVFTIKWKPVHVAVESVFTIPWKHRSPSRGIRTEHIFVPHAGPKETRDIDTLILDAVQAKETKGGAAYAMGKTLIVFLDAGLGEWKPNVVARKLPPGHFKNVWLVGLHGPVEDGEYTYAVTCLRTGLDPRLGAPTWLVRVHKTFESWDVKSLQ